MPAERSPSEHSPSPPGRDPQAAARQAAWVIGASLVVAIVAALGVVVVRWTDGSFRVGGTLAGIALLGIAVALVVWSRHLLEHREHSEARPSLPSSCEERAAFAEAWERGELIERRSVLRRLLVGALAATGLAALVPVRSIGPAPDGALRRTPWRRGMRLIDEDGAPLAVDGLPVGSFATVFPDGHPGSADGQAVLIRVAADQVPDQTAPDGLLVYSKVCTHAGCPVGLYQTETQTLLCPCHQSTFDVLDGAQPTSGPAARALPRLPVRVDDEGYVVADGDFEAPVGPAWWSRP